MRHQPTGKATLILPHLDQQNQPQSNTPLIKTQLGRSASFCLLGGTSQRAYEQSGKVISTDSIKHTQGCILFSISFVYIVGTGTLCGAKFKIIDEGGKNMFKKNMGRLDRMVRFIVGAALIPIGLFLLGGWQGNLFGIIVAIFALVPLLTSLIGFCPGYIPFGISTLGKKQNSTKLSIT